MPSNGNAHNRHLFISNRDNVPQTFPTQQAGGGKPSTEAHDSQVTGLWQVDEKELTQALLEFIYHATQN